jgi:hypothetical protein
MLLISMLAACNQTSEVTPTSIPAETIKPTPSSTVTIQPTNTSTQPVQFTSTPTQTPKPTPAFTWTALPILPTLPTGKANSLLSDLLINNGGCKLPCWWGITPGETPWNEAYQTLSTFATIDGPSVMISSNIPHEFYAINFNKGAKNYRFAIWIANNIVEEIVVPTELSTYSHQLDQVLTDNGTPGEVWLAVMPDTPGGSFFYLILNYPDQGIIAEFDGNAKASYAYNSKGEVDITSLTICPIGIGPNLSLTAPNNKVDLFGMSEKFDTFGQILVPLQDESQMSPEEFYLAFRDGSSTTCFETFSDTWP